MKFDNKQQAEQAMQLAIGRIFNLGSRPFQEGDTEKYFAARDVALDAAEYLGIDTEFFQQNNHARDYNK